MKNLSAVKVLVNRRHLFFVILFALVSCQDQSVEPSEDQIPNVLFIAIDDLNDWIGCMGGHPNAKTPNIDRLAARGTLFTNAHCQAPICGPSRASVMTGLRPSNSGIYGQINDGDLTETVGWKDSMLYLPQYFSRHGYQTLGKGKLFHQHAPDGVFDISAGRERGFGPKPAERFKYDPSWFGKPSGTSTDWGVFPQADTAMPDYRTATWGIEQLQKDHADPFFLALGFLRPHVPWYVPKKWFDLHPLDSIELPPYLANDQADVPEIARRVNEIPMMPDMEWVVSKGYWKEICQAYLACISFVDHYVGEILDALEESAYADNTIIVLWSDHGYHIGEKSRFAKHSTWQRSSRVPLIFAGLDLPQNQMINKPVELLDLYPTLLDMCGLPSNPINDGKSLKSLILNPSVSWPHVAITTYGKNNHALQTEDFRYTHYADGSEELYDLKNDPNEWTNLAKESAYQSLKQDFKTRLPEHNAPWASNAYLRVNDYFNSKD